MTIKKPKYIQKGLYREFEQPHNRAESNDIDVAIPPFRQGDRVLIKPLNEWGFVWNVHPEKATVLLDRDPNLADHFPFTDLILEHHVAQPPKFGGHESTAATKKNSHQNLVATEQGVWIERSYKTVAGKRYGPYYLKRWIDANGKRRSQYIGKAKSS